MKLSFKTDNKNETLNNYDEINSNKYSRNYFSFPSEVDELKKENSFQTEKTLYEFFPFQKTKNNYDYKNQENNPNMSNEIQYDNFKNKKNSKKKKEKKQKSKILYGNIKNSSINKNKEINIEQCNYIKNINLDFTKESPKINSMKENESEDTTSFATDNNLSSINNNSFNVNSVDRLEKNQMLISKQNNSLFDLIENSFYDLNTKKYNDFNKLNLSKNYNNDNLFFNDSEQRKKKNKKKKKRKKNNSNKINDCNIIDKNNSINQMYLNQFDGLNTYNNIFSNLNSTKINNFNIYSNNFYNNDKPDKKNNSYLSKFLRDSNNKQDLNSKNENVEKNMKEKKEKDITKKYIYMSDILSCPPIKINQKCTKPFIINKQVKKKILLNIKIKIPNSNNYIEVPIREEEDPVLIIDNLKLVLNEYQKKKLIEDIKNSLKLIINFNNLSIGNNSLDILNTIKNNINWNNVV